MMVCLPVQPLQAVVFGHDETPTPTSRAMPRGAALWTGNGLGLDAAQPLALLAAFPCEELPRPVAGAREELGSLRARGLRTGVPSDTPPSTDQTLEAAGLADLVDAALRLVEDGGA